MTTKKWVKFSSIILFSILSSKAKCESYISGSDFGAKRGVVWTGSATTGNWQSSAKNDNGTHNLSLYFGSGLSATYPGSYWGEIDGRKGLILAPGILLEFSGTSAFTTSGTYYAKPLTAVYEWGKDPTVSDNTDYTIQYNYQRWSTLVRSTLTNWFYSASTSSTLYLYKKNNIQPRLYLSADVLPGDYNFSGNIDIVDYESPESRYSRIISNISFTTSTFECVISPPPTVNFGQVIAKGDGWVSIGNQDSLLNVNCISDSAGTKRTAAISFSGSQLYYNRAEMLELKTNDTSVGIINGRYGKSNVSDCGNLNSERADAVKFDGTVSKTLELGVGTNQVPITWTICRRGDAQRYGDTSAQATVNISWD